MNVFKGILGATHIKYKIRQLVLGTGTFFACIGDVDDYGLCSIPCP